MKEIKQKSYGTLEIDNSEKDIIQIWMNQGDESNVIQIERENVKELIKILKYGILPEKEREAQRAKWRVAQAAYRKIEVIKPKKKIDLTNSEVIKPTYF